MRIINFYKGTVSSVIATPKQVRDKTYHNIEHGSDTGWEFRASVDFRLTSNKGINPMEINGDDYILREIKKKGVVTKDEKGNPYCVLTKDRTQTTTLDVIIFWKLAHDKINEATDIEYSLSGAYTRIGEGDFGIRDKPIPAPVFIVHGEVYFKWVGKDKNDNDIGESYKYTLDGKFKKV